MPPFGMIPEKIGNSVYCLSNYKILWQTNQSNSAKRVNGPYNKTGTSRVSRRALVSSARMIKFVAAPKSSRILLRKTHRWPKKADRNQDSLDLSRSQTTSRF
jgi:hypothetical protein